ncbi:ABC transporter substrate-binding protein [Thauera mechernichensis]|uniref:ABC transporter substrate-binding protein n=1 Tax=Thauera mechernichensis TaxID=82788 RepID=A0ABW3W8D9_9RHOO|nr:MULTISPECIES: ABC transporter substrate-binding protein [Thauera]ENO81804.1 extracellular ligand-binding receptor [Thauera sp. 27]ENO92652.1 extracellular ligand-binding receptor [Thauera sp. 28]MDG3064372.1 ABC transporter substrate-binding protein [Thauera mechernichensis]WBL63948.1 ABC transporter substrate-binding protein [Thauera sp. WB-2]HAG77079.1 amino acid ABC transporter substrate-binding protein [Thauera sp.]
MNKKTLATLVGSLLGAAVLASPAHAQNVKIGLLGGISGPIAAMAPSMLDASRLAIAQVNEQGGILNGGKLDVVVGDSACNPQNATDAATKAVNIDRVIATVGPHCSGAVLAAANSVTVPAGVLMVTPSGTSPEITKINDKDLVYRTVPSDDYQGRALARTLKARGIDKVAVAYLNNDYGKGLAESFKAEYEANGGTIAGYSGHEDGKASYRSDLAQLARGGADTLVIFDYGDGTGLTILRQALENNFFKTFIGADGMKSEAVIRSLGEQNLGGFFASAPVGEASASLDAFRAAFSAAGGNPDAIFTTTSYDAAFLVALAIEKAGGDKAKLAESLRAVASAPGEPIMAGEWAKAKQLIAEGKDIDYKGAAGDHEFDAAGDVPGNYAFFKVSGSTYEAIADMK